MPTPDFIIAGTQKGGTTWLEHHLESRPDVHTPRRQLHFFDRHFEKGLDWYYAWFQGAGPGVLTGEKTTEYFDPAFVQLSARRIAETCPESRIIIVLRDPARRALSALQHHVNSGLEPIPVDPEATIFADRERPAEASFRYIERGFYAGQFETFRSFIHVERILTLIFEEDVIADPEGGMRKTCAFLGLDYEPQQELGRAVNELRLSKLAIRLSRAFYDVPYARGAIRRADRLFGLKPWQPVWRDETLPRLRALYADDITKLEAILDRDIPSWKPTGS